MVQKTVPAPHRAAVVGVIDPAAKAAATYTSGWIAMANFQQVMAIIMAGTLGASATLDAKFEQATDAAGAGAKDVVGSAITQLTKAGSDDSKQALVSLYAEDLDANNNFTHVRLSMTIATATSGASALVLGFDCRYGPASAYDAASVDEIVIVA
ncbi:hypothetical protein GCM10010873_26650 [Cypionkella aquatica]|uniref:Uncharacterized protein n=1 Tax=Cypionkella aquatica TaxID=1756042 RepID=A0AA37U3D7_9RHOB|nr:hypothetical protein [Cypionkella aquatica]GLS87691.1 hypothetical protein GCM10010873_26650 [Cypionkella aquatica]